MIEDVPAINPNRVYRLSEVAVLVGVHESTLRRWIKEKHLKFSKLGREYRVLGSQIINTLNWLAEAGDGRRR